MTLKMKGKFYGGGQVIYSKMESPVVFGGRAFGSWDKICLEGRRENQPEELTSNGVNGRDEIKRPRGPMNQKEV
jgi:hypothetical protein